MSLKCVRLEVPIKSTTDQGNERVTYFFRKEEHARILFKNLGSMQSEGLMADVDVWTKDKKHSEPFHSVLLAAYSPTIKQYLVRSMSREITLKEMTNNECLESFRDFLYKSKVALSKQKVDALDELARRYYVNSLGKLCGVFKDQLRGSEEFHVLLGNHEGVLAEMYDMFQREEFTRLLLEDVKGRTQLEVHGPLIAAASPVLQNLFVSDLLNQGGIKYRLNIPSAILRTVIEYIYSASVTLEGKTVIDVLKAAAKYELPALVKACCDWLISRITGGDDAVDNLCLVRELNSDMTALIDLKHASKNYILANFSDICKGDELNELYYEDLLNIINEKTLDVQRGEDVFSTVMKWVNASGSDRPSRLCDLVQCTHLEFTSLTFLDEAEKDSRIGKCSRCLKVVKEARQRISLEKDASEISSKQEYDLDPALCKQTKGATTNNMFCSDEGKENDDQLPAAEEDEFLDRIKALLNLFPTESVEQCENDKESALKKTLPHKDGVADMCYRENREVHMKKGENKNGSDCLARLEENRDQHGLVTRGAIVKAAVGGPVKNSGTTGMHLKLSKEAWCNHQQQRFGRKHAFTAARTGDQAPLRKPGREHVMSFKEARPRVHSPARKGTNIPGPISKDGTSDMRPNMNTEPRGSQGARRLGVAATLKIDARPTMLYETKEQNSTQSSSLVRDKKWSVPAGEGCGALKKDGSPDIKFKTKRPCGIRARSPLHQTTDQ